MKNKNVKYAYLAGIIDGEGCISITKSKEKNRKNYNFSSELSVEMGKSNVPKYLYKIFKGSLKCRKRKDRKYFMYTWYICGRKMNNILKKIYPYLIQKKQEARLHFKYNETLIYPKGRITRLTTKIIKLRNKLILRLKKEKKYAR